MTTNTEERLAALERRLQRLEDYIALYQTVSTYGPSVDGQEFDQALNLWEENGIYDLGDGYPLMEGPEDVREMLDGPVAKPALEQGGAHVSSLPLLKISGDRALGICYHRNYLHQEGGTRIWRLAASRWEWRRQSSGEWKIVRRTHRLLDGTEAGRALLRETLEEIKAAGQSADRP